MFAVEMKLVQLALSVLFAGFFVLMSPVNAQEHIVKYRCDRQRSFAAIFLSQQAKVTLDNGKSLLMRQVPTDSGIRYVNAGYTLSGEGGEAIISLEETAIYTNCVSRSNMTGSNTVTGSVTYRPRVALPANAIVKVQLLQIVEPQAPPNTIAQQEIQTNGRQVPISFALTYNPEHISPNQSYEVIASILVNGQLRWINTTRYRVITQGNPKQIEVVVDAYS